MLAVRGELVANQNAAARADWKTDHVVVLRIAAQNVSSDTVIARLATACAGSSRPRTVTSISDGILSTRVVETKASSSGGRSEFTSTGCERISNRVAVLRPVEPVHRQPASTGAKRSLVERRFQMRDETVECSRVWPRDADRRHHARAHLPDDFFPDLSASGNISKRDAFEHQPRCLEAFVVTRDAVLLEERRVIGRWSSSGLGRRRS